MNIHWLRRFKGWQPARMIPICGSIGAPRSLGAWEKHGSEGGNSALRCWFLCSPGCHDPWKAGVKRRPWPHWTWTPKIPGDVEKFLAFLLISTVKFETLCRAGWSFQVFLSFFYHHHEGYLGVESHGWLPGCLCLRQRKVLLSVASSFGAQLVGLLGADAFATWQVGRGVSNPMTGIYIYIYTHIYIYICIIYIYIYILPSPWRA